MSPSASDASIPASLEELLGIAAGGDPARGWWWLPSPASRRVAVPCDPRGWPAALQLLETPRKRRVGALRLRGHRLFHRTPDWRAPENKGPLDAWLAEIWPGVPLRFAIYRGTPNIFVKDSIQCQAADGRVLGYVKVPRGRRAGEAVANEAAALEKLGVTFADAPFSPALLGRRGGLSVQAAAGVGGPRVPVIEAAAAVLRLMESRLAENFTWQDSPQRHDLVRAITAIASAGHGSRADALLRSMSILDRELGDAPLAHPFSHGDLVPWNFSPSGCLFDWEWAGHRLPLHDAFHHLWMPRILKGRRLNPAALAAIWEPGPGRILHGATAPAIPPPSLARAYLLWQSSFYDAATLENGDPVEGVRLLERLHELAIDPPPLRG